MKSEYELLERLRESNWYHRQLEQLTKLEQDRRYCRHDEAHFGETARIAVSVCKQCGVQVEDTVLLLAAYLHDLGRVKQYESGISHETASVRLANNILPQIGCPDEMIQQVLSLIGGHREFSKEKLAVKEVTKLQQMVAEMPVQNRAAFLFAWADKRSRNCFSCDVSKSCHWPEKLKNLDMF
jgi:putative nucleotidyltransferase with HDIG domain